MTDSDYTIAIPFSFHRSGSDLASPTSLECLFLLASDSKSLDVHLMVKHFESLFHRIMVGSDSESFLFNALSSSKRVSIFMAKATSGEPQFFLSAQRHKKDQIV